MDHLRLNKLVKNQGAQIKFSDAKKAVYKIQCYTENTFD